MRSCNPAPRRSCYFNVADRNMMLVLKKAQPSTWPTLEAAAGSRCRPARAARVERAAVAPSAPSPRPLGTLGTPSAPTPRPLLAVAAAAQRQPRRHVLRPRPRRRSRQRTPRPRPRPPRPLRRCRWRCRTNCSTSWTDRCASKTPARGEPLYPCGTKFDCQRRAHPQTQSYRRYFRARLFRLIFLGFRVLVTFGEHSYCEK